VGHLVYSSFFVARVRFGASAFASGAPASALAVVRLGAAVLVPVALSVVVLAAVPVFGAALLLAGVFAAGAVLAFG
jgi:hypothetical protein